MPMIGGIAAWTLADLVIYPVVYSQFGSGWSVHLLRIAISGLIGLPLMFFIINGFSKVELDDR